MDPTDDVNSKCRACLTVDPLQLFNWNNDMVENLTYMNCFRQCTQLEELEDEPTMLCYHCASELKSTYDFIQKTRKSDRELRLKRHTIYTTEESSLDKLELGVPTTDAKIRKRKVRKKSEESKDVDQILKQNKAPTADKSKKPKVKCKIKLPKDKSAKVTKKARVGRPKRELPAQQSIEIETLERNIASKYVCHICSLTFYDASTLQIHIHTHEENVRKEQPTDNSIECQICKKHFLDPIDLIDHLRSHPGDCPYHCPHCDKAFKQVNKFNNHVRRHEGYRYRCDICEQKCPNKSALSQHSKQHTNIPLKCGICGKKFLKKSEIRSHINAVHKKMDTKEVDKQKVKKKRVCRSRVVEVY